MYINAAEWLQDIRATNIRIHNKQKQLTVLDNMLEAKAITYNPDRVSTTPRKDGLENLAIKHIEEREKLYAEIQKDITYMLRKMDEATDYISMIESEDQQEVLMLRYIECRSWSDIMTIRECDDISGQYKLHKRALDSLQKILMSIQCPQKK
jgi:predicted site-specific integrase-resolvase